MFSSACPSCGAPVSFRSTASTSAICSFCKSTLVRDADTLKRIGKQGDLFDDASRIQVGTGAIYRGSAFTVIGRIQLQYESGYWNEWYVLFVDGKTGWMSEASGIYAVLLEVSAAPATALPTFGQISVGQTLKLGGQIFRATDKRVARCVSAEGELPFALTDRWEAQTIDFQAGDAIATLDYSEPKTALYTGHTVPIEALKFTLLKQQAPNTLGDAAIGKINSKTIQALACVSCGANIKFVPSLTPEIICPQCSSRQTPSTGNSDSPSLAIQAAVVEASKRHTLLVPGDAGALNGIEWTVLGVLVKHSQGYEAEPWEEYLIYNPTKQFAWLVFSDFQWQFGAVLTQHPVPIGDAVSFGGSNLAQSDSYVAITDYAAGSFNWKVKVGESVSVAEYKGNGVSLSRESTASEVTWTQSRALNGLEVLKSFGKRSSTPAPRGQANSRVDRDGEKKPRSANDLALIFSVLLVVFTAPAWLMVGVDGPIEELMIGLFALWLPLGYFGED
jgi:Zn finger protein HypA/HybF involved in hydrogenase expression